MEIEFGKIEIDRPEEEAQIPKVKNILEEFFGKRKIKNFSRIYIANPHQALADDYELKQSSPETLELYFYTAPSNIASDIGHLSDVSVCGKKVATQNGQSDSVVVVGVAPKGFTLIEDESGNQLALAKGNKVWILNDLIHNISESKTAEEVAKTLLNFVIETYLDPPSPDEVRRRVIEKMDEVIKGSFGKAKGELEATVKQLTAELQSLESQIGERIRTLAAKSEMLEIANLRKKPDGEEILQKIERMRFVKNVNFKGGFLNVETQPINIGPFEYGEWKITLKPDAPSYQHPLSGKVRHPYQYAEGHFCMGGFEKEYILAVSAGNYDRAVSLARLEITNYSTSTRMKDLEEYLTAHMGKEKFNKLMKTIKDEHSPDSDGLQFSSVVGSKVTFVATKNAKDGHPVATSERIVIDYVV